MKRGLWPFIAFLCLGWASSDGNGVIPPPTVTSNTDHTFVLSAALTRWAEAQGLSNGNYHGYVVANVPRRIGVYTASMMRTVESDSGQGSPMGLYPSVAYLAKTGPLLHDGGRRDNEQLLHPKILTRALFRDKAPGHPTGGRINDLPELNRHGFWGFPVTGSEDCTITVPYMSGYDGNMLVIAPTGSIGIRLSDNQNNTVDGIVTILQTHAPLACP